MEITSTRVNITRTRENWPPGEFLPAHIFPRKDKESWIVLDSRYVLGEVPSFALTDADPYIRIPLFQYRLNPVGDAALSFMLQFGLSFANYIAKPIAKLHIVQGEPVELIYSNSQLTHMNFWVGFAFTFAGKNNDQTN